MTKDEAKKVLNVLLYAADRCCDIDAGALFVKFVKAFPKFYALSEELLLKEFKRDLKHYARMIGEADELEDILKAQKGGENVA